MFESKRENSILIFNRPKVWSFRYIVKQLLYPVACLWYRFLLLTAGKKQASKKYNVAVCAIFKNEAPYLREWIEFNHIVGVEHFYLYNNDSNDDFQNILQPYIESGLVTLKDWPGAQQQMPAYYDCFEKFAKETKWLGFIDVDEFVVPKSTNNLYEFLQKFECYGAVNMYWRIFGSSGIVERDIKGLVTEDFIVCYPKLSDIGKCFYNTVFDINISSAKNIFWGHKFWVSIFGCDIPPVNCFGKLTFWECDPVKNVEFPIQINHYWTKSYKEYEKKSARGSAFHKKNWKTIDSFFENDGRCTAVDYSAYKYLVKLKLAMETDKQ